MIHREYEEKKLSMGGWFRAEKPESGFSVIAFYK